jgi:ribonuclease E
VALYLLNQKRAHLRGLEERFAITITVTADETVRAPQTFVIDRGEQVHTPEAAKAIAERAQAPVAPLEDEDDLDQAGAAGSAADETDFQSDAGTELGEPLPAEHGEGGSRRRRRRRRRGRGSGEHMQSQPQHHHVEHIPIVESSDDFNAEDQNATGEESPADETVGFAPEAQSERKEPRRDDRRRRRGRRGGRRNRQRNGESGYSGGDQWSERDERDVAQSEPLTEQAGAESELTHAVADLDSRPAERVAPQEASATPVEQPEPARRRSTVREPAPGAGVAATAPDNPPPGASSPAEPVVTETGETSKGERPRRTGWWSRRFAGG